MPAHRRAAFRGLRAAAPGGAPVFGHACLRRLMDVGGERRHHDLMFPLR